MVNIYTPRLRHVAEGRVTRRDIVFMGNAGLVPPVVLPEKDY